MAELREQPRGRRLLGALLGIKAGVIGAAAILIFMAVVSLAERDPWWAYPNLLATAFYGARALQLGPGWSTLSGAAFQVILAGVAGAIFGAIFSGVQSGTRLLLLGIIWGVSYFYLTHNLFRTFARLIPVYAPEVALLIAHAMFGMILGGLSRARWIPARADTQPSS